MKGENSAASCTLSLIDLTCQPRSQLAALTSRHRPCVPLRGPPPIPITVGTQFFCPVIPVEFRFACSHSKSLLNVLKSQNLNSSRLCRQDLTLVVLCEHSKYFYKVEEPLHLKKLTAEKETARPFIINM